MGDTRWPVPMPAAERRALEAREADAALEQQQQRPVVNPSTLPDREYPDMGALLTRKQIKRQAERDMADARERERATVRHLVPRLGYGDEIAACGRLITSWFEIANAQNGEPTCEACRARQGSH